MPALAKLVVTSLRNIQEAELGFATGFNLFFGDNGSGKTSVLEAIHLLALGRSFRSHLQKPLIMEGLTEATVFGLTADGLPLGIRRPLRGPQTIHIAGKKADSLAELSHSLPLQLINSDTFSVLEGSPQERRRFIDWGVFHVEHHFLHYWRRAKLALQNRNSLLKREAAPQEIEPWTLELVRNAELMDQYRSSYVDKLKKVLNPSLEQLLEIEQERPVSLEYDRGWNQDTGLYEQLHKDLARDRRYGFTSTGPHRADLRFRIGAFDAADVLSRGQLKLLIAVLKIAQGELLLKETGRHCIFLIDDLPAELDARNRAHISRLLAELKSQVFLTCIEENLLAADVQQVCQRQKMDYKLFHVKHGTITLV